MKSRRNLFGASCLSLAIKIAFFFYPIHHSTSFVPDVWQQANFVRIEKSRFDSRGESKESHQMQIVLNWPTVTQALLLNMFNDFFLAPKINIMSHAVKGQSFQPWKHSEDANNQSMRLYFALPERGNSGTKSGLILMSHEQRHSEKHLRLENAELPYNWAAI